MNVACGPHLVSPVLSNKKHMVKNHCFLLQIGYVF